MAIARFTASADTTITNAYKSSLIDTKRATGSNMGASDVLEVFSIYAQASSSTSELSRTLLNFPISEVSASRVAGTIPVSGSVDFYLRMFNAEHAYTTPSSYTLQVTPVSQSWEEGYGLDMEEYQDDTEDGIGANWLNATSTTRWADNQATATFTVLATGGGSTIATANFDEKTITIESTDGTSVVYTFDNAVENDSGDDAPTIGVQLSSPNLNTLSVGTAIADAINAAGGHNGKITAAVAVSGVNAVVTLTQAAHASAGNTTITKTVLDAHMTINGNTGTDPTPGDFSGGTDIVGGVFDTEGVTYSVSFSNGDEDLEANITELVEEWIAGGDASPSVDNRPSYGLGVFLSGQYESYHSSSALVYNDGAWTAQPPVDGVLLHNLTGSKRSYYTKKFFSRTSEYFFKRPMIEARWDSSTKDNRANFYASSSLANESDNMNTIYLYNMVRGQYKNIPSVGDGQLYVRLYLDKTDTSATASVTITSLDIAAGDKVVLLATDDIASSHFTVVSSSPALGVSWVKGASLASTANNLAACIDGHAKFSAVSDGVSKVTITQSVGGSEGNTTVVLTETDDWATAVSFSGGNEPLTGMKQKTGTNTSQAINDFVTGGLVPGKTGIYSASIALDTTSSIVYDRWFDQVNATATWTLDGASNDFNHEVQFVLKDTTGTSHTFTFKTDSNTVSNNNIGIQDYAGGSNTSANRLGITARVASSINNYTTAPISAVDNLDQTITLTQDVDGTAGNQTNSQDAGNVGFTVGNFSGGRDINNDHSCFHTGTINVKSLDTGDYNTNMSYATKITNLKSKYFQNETARFRTYVRDKNWSPNSYTKYVSDISSSVIDSAYYKIVRVQDDLTIVDYGTGSTNHTLLSYDSKGNYFDFDVSMLEQGFSYGIKLVYKRDNVYHEQPEIFKFRVE